MPVDHPALNSASDVTGQIPLITLPQLRLLKNSDSARNSLESDKRSSLPTSVRASYDGKISPGLHRQLQQPSPVGRFADSANMGSEDGQAQRQSRDVESTAGGMVRRQSTASSADGDGTGSRVSSSNSSIMGEDVHADVDEWGPQHPCFPHMNPHVPLDSPEYLSTRIIRVKRDWMVEGDLAPTFSNLYPEILDPAGLPEQEFRRIIEKINGDVISIFNPYGGRNMLDAILGVATGWLWDDFGLTSAKSRLDKLEKWIETWNQTMVKNFSPNDAYMIPRIISLRQTGYMTVCNFSRGSKRAEFGLANMVPTARYTDS